MSESEQDHPESFNDLIRTKASASRDRTPQELAADAIEAAQNNETFNDQLRRQMNERNQPKA